MAGTVFKVERGPAGEKIAYVRMFAGTLAVRDRCRRGKVTAISVADRPVPTVHAGQIGKLWGLAGVRIGERLGSPRTTGSNAIASFAPPSLETVVVPQRAGDRGALRAALGQLAEQDPLINLRQDAARQEISVSLYGEVQKEVIQATLHDEYGIDVRFRETTTICVERPNGTGARGRVPEATRRSSPRSGCGSSRGRSARASRYGIGVELGSMPFAFMKAVEETVHETLRRGLARLGGRSTAR